MPRPGSSDTGWLAPYRRLLSQWARGNTRRHDAEDAVQDAAAALLARPPDTALQQPGAYLWRASQNRLINEVRRQARQDTVALEELADEAHPLWTDPDAAIRLQQLAQALEQALAQLPLRKRQAFIWHRLEGYTQPEIAARLGVSLNSVERYLMDATRHVRDALQGFCPP